MEFFKSDYFRYEENELLCEKVSVGKLAKEYGTPLYIYSKKFFQDRYNEFSEAFKSIDHTIFFATKSNFNLNVMKIFADMGSGIDVNSAGELYRALKIGVDPKKILLTGVGKTTEEIRLGLENDVLMIKAESLQEAVMIDKIAGEMGKVAPLAFRVNPDVDPQTHPYISTGLAENKFGIDSKFAKDIFKKVDQLRNVELTGIDMHIGSQITNIDPYVESVLKMRELIKELKGEGIDIKHFDIGGGMGITYKDEKPFSPKELADALIPIFMQLDCEIMFEPGRSMTANGGVLVTQVLYTKANSIGKNFVVIDGAMTDLLRPSIYGAYHHIQPVKLENRNDIEADIVGPVCESGDFLGKNRTISEVNQGDLLAVMSTGAYGMVMASNYNGRRRPAEVIVDGDKYYTARSRETFEHLLFDEEIISDLHK